MPRSGGGGALGFELGVELLELGRLAAAISRRPAWIASAARSGEGPRCASDDRRVELIARSDGGESLPDVFEVDDCARVVGAAADQDLMQAACGCPTEAIVLVDSETGARVFP